MNLFLISIVLLAALLHASWNALAKSGGTPAYKIASYQLFGATVCLFFVPLVPIPDANSWWFIAASVAIHNVYYFTLAQSYRHGDLSQVYPLFRGLAPVIVTIGAGLFASEWLPLGSVIGIVLISFGLISLTLFSGQLGRISRPALMWGLITSVLIGAYTIVDGMGARVAGDPFAYIIWLFLFEPVPICLFLMLTDKTGFLGFLKSNKTNIAIGGTLSSLAYGLVIFAMSLGAMGMVSSLRETSVIFAAVIGSLFLKEPFGKQRIIAAGLVATGILAMRYFA